MTMKQAFAPSEEKYKEQVMAETWGHLAPKKNKKYHGRIVFAFDIYGGKTLAILYCNFKGLDDSPWFFNNMQDFLFTYSNLERGILYEFKGCFINYRFDGEINPIYNPMKG